MLVGVTIQNTADQSAVAYPPRLFQRRLQLQEKNIGYEKLTPHCDVRQVTLCIDPDQLFCILSCQPFFRLAADVQLVWHVSLLTVLHLA